jgi:hypothetical protein
MPERKKLLIINPNQFGYSAGYYYYCKYLESKFEIEYLCFDKGRKKLYSSKTLVHYISYNNGKFMRTFSFIKASVKLSWQFKPDVLFVLYFKWCFLLSLLCKSSVKILDIRTGSLSSNKIKRKLVNSAYHIQSLFFSKTIILSESLRQLLRIGRAKSLLLSLGAEIYFSGQHDFTSIRLLYIGTFNRRRISDTIEGLAIFLNRFPEIKNNLTYTIVGFGSEEEESKLRNTIRQFQLDTIVSFEGLKNYEEIKPYFKKANIGVAYVPLTDYYKTQPSTKLFEYVLSGIYTIATANPENSNFINDLNGILCKDNPESFAESLAHCYQKLSRLDSNVIRNTLSGYQWECLVEAKLYPFLNGK